MKINKIPLLIKLVTYVITPLCNLKHHVAYLQKSRARSILLHYIRYLTDLNKSCNMQIYGSMLIIN
jgi:hypothetical protein